MQRYRVSIADLICAAGKHVDLVILVNPNSPPGQHLDRTELEDVINCLPKSTRIGIDETYVESGLHDFC